MAQRIAADTWAIQGETITLPVTITDARLTAAVFTCPAANARDMLAGTPLRPLVAAGRAVSVLLCIHYGPWALKSYDEVGIGLLALGPGGRPGLHLVDLPVTGAFTREAGRDLWALPKWVMSADLWFTPGETSVVVRDGDREVMRARVRHGRRVLPAPVRSGLPVWSYLDHGAQAGSLLRGRVPMNLSGVRLARGACDVRLPPGDPHPMASRMRSLGMLGRPLFTTHAERLSGPLGAWRPVGSAAARRPGSAPAPPRG
nr:acetoacetate decarboxylase family protein [uncultured Actinoplanes sp.]